MCRRYFCGLWAALWHFHQSCQRGYSEHEVTSLEQSASLHRWERSWSLQKANAANGFGGMTSASVTPRLTGTVPWGCPWRKCGHWGKQGAKRDGGIAFYWKHLFDFWRQTGCNLCFQHYCLQALHWSPKQTGHSFKNCLLDVSPNRILMHGGSKLVPGVDEFLAGLAED